MESDEIKPVTLPITVGTLAEVVPVVKPIGRKKNGEERKTNPNGANQYLLDPRQKACWDYYVNPKSETFGNALQSAIRAGYEEETAKRITVAEWFLVKIRRLNLLDKAEKVLEEMVTMPVLVEKTIGHGDDAEEVVRTDVGLVKVKQDTAKFLAERLGKDQGYSSRSEVTGAGGEKLMPSAEDVERAREAIKNLSNDIRGNTTHE